MFSTPVLRLHPLRRRLHKMADPGKVRLRFALGLVLSIAAAAIVSWAIAKATGQLKLQMPLPDGTVMEIEVHSVMMMLGAILALVQCMVPLPADRKIRGVVLTIFPVFFLIGHTIGQTFNGGTLSGIVGLCAAGTVLVLLQKEPKLVLVGLPMFFGTFMAVFTRTEFSQLGWIALTIIPAGLASMLVQVILCPNPHKIVRDVFTSFDQSTDAVLERTNALLIGAAGDAKARSALVDAAHRLEKISLIADGQLAGETHGLSDEAVASVHCNVFDREAALSALVDAALSYDAVRGSASLPDGVTNAISALVDDDTATATRVALRAHAAADAAVAADPTDIAARSAYRLVVALGHAVGGWKSLEEIIEAADHVGAAYEPSITLDSNGDVVTSGPALQRVLGDGPTVLGFPAPVFQRGVRMVLALSIASALGYWLSEVRWYYGFFGAFSVMMSANGSGEHIRSAVERAFGTLVGAAVAVAIADTFSGHLVLTYIALFAMIGIAFYLQRPSDALSSAALCVMVGFLYLQMGNYESVVLWDRVWETALGGAVAIIIALTVFRVPSDRLAQSSAGELFEELATVHRNVFASLTGEGDVVNHRPGVRRSQEHIYQIGHLKTPAMPFFGSTNGIGEDHRAVLSALVNEVAELARDASVAAPFAAQHHAAVRAIGARLGDDLTRVGDWLSGQAGSPKLVRSNDLYELDRAVRVGGGERLDAQLAVVGHLIDINEQLINLLNIDEAPSPDDRAAVLVSAPLPPMAPSLSRK